MPILYNPPNSVLVIWSFFEEVGLKSISLLGGESDLSLARDVHYSDPLFMTVASGRVLLAGTVKENSATYTRASLCISEPAIYYSS